MHRLAICPADLNSTYLLLLYAFLGRQAWHEGLQVSWMWAPAVAVSQTVSRPRDLLTYYWCIPQCLTESGYIAGVAYMHFPALLHCSMPTQFYQV